MAADEEIPASLVPAVLSGLEALAGVPDEVLAEHTAASRKARAEAVVAVLRHAIDERAIVTRAAYDDLDALYRQAAGRFDRVSAQMAAVGEKRAELEQLCHQLAEALMGGGGGDSALAAYRAMEW